MAAGGGLFAGSGGLFAGGPFAAGLIAGGPFASGLNAAHRGFLQSYLKRCYDFDLPSLKIDRSSRLLGCYCHSYYLCQLVRFIRLQLASSSMLKNVNKLQFFKLYNANIMMIITCVHWYIICNGTKLPMVMLTNVVFSCIEYCLLFSVTSSSVDKWLSSQT